MMRRRLSVMTTVIAMAAVSVAIAACGSSEKNDEKQPPLTQEQLVAKGRSIFNSTCATCHSVSLQGGSMAPSMLQAAFAPAQLPDSAISQAIQNGVNDNRFGKGPMPAQPSVHPKDIPAVIAYIRWVQQANGIK